MFARSLLVACTWKQDLGGIACAIARGTDSITIGHAKAERSLLQVRRGGPFFGYHRLVGIFVNYAC